MLPRPIMHFARPCPCPKNCCATWTHDSSDQSPAKEPRRSGCARSDRDSVHAPGEGHLEQSQFARLRIHLDRPKGGFLLYATPATRPKKRGIVPRMLDALGKAFPVNKHGKLRRSLTAIFRAVDHVPLASRALERTEFVIKSPLFGCQACGNCALGSLEYVCPQTWPKNLRNGPCGGTSQGQCEVVDKPCIWVDVYDRTKAAHRLDDLRTYIPPLNPLLQGTSSWINYFLGRDNRPEKTTTSTSL
jgi:hypothetical protein